jgi:hypothetical protein
MDCRQVVERWMRDGQPDPIDQGALLRGGQAAR